MVTYEMVSLAFELQIQKVKIIILGMIHNYDGIQIDTVTKTLLSHDDYFLSYF